MEQTKQRRKKSPQIVVSCLQCSALFKVRSSWVSYGYGKYCSRACFGISTRGRLVSEEWRKKSGMAHKGRKKTPEEKKKNSDAHKGEKSPFWKGGVAKKNNTLRQNIMATTEYRQWRTGVFERDNYTCQGCNARNGNGAAIKLNADHIEAFSALMTKHQVTSVQIALVCADLWNLNNGRTLCIPCHRQTPNFGARAIKKT